MVDRDGWDDALEKDKLGRAEFYKQFAVESLERGVEPRSPNNSLFEFYKQFAVPSGLGQSFKKSFWSNAFDFASKVDECLKAEGKYKDMDSGVQTQRGAGVCAHPVCGTARCDCVCGK